MRNQRREAILQVEIGVCSNAAAAALNQGRRRGDLGAPSLRWRLGVALVQNKALPARR
jgi:hypothetical protein